MQPKGKGYRIHTRIADVRWQVVLETAVSTGAHRQHQKCHLRCTDSHLAQRFVLATPSASEGAGRRDGKAGHGRAGQGEWRGRTRWSARGGLVEWVYYRRSIHVRYLCYVARRCLGGNIHRVTSSFTARSIQHRAQNNDEGEESSSITTTVVSFPGGAVVKACEWHGLHGGYGEREGESWERLLPHGARPLACLLVLYYLWW